MTDSVELDWQSCFGRCTKGPNLLVQEKSTTPAIGHSFVLAPPPPARGKRVSMYNHVALGDIDEIVTEHLQGRRPVRRLLEKRSKNTNSEAIAKAAGENVNTNTVNTDTDGD